jgi:hypothetical protein
MQLNVPNGQNLRSFQNCFSDTETDDRLDDQVCRPDARARDTDSD